MFLTLQWNVFFVATIFASVYVYFKFVIYSYWRKLGVIHANPIIPYGNALPIVLGKKSVGEFLEDTYEKFKKYSFHGIYMFHKPVLMINDPELIRQVFVKDFHKFSSRGIYVNEHLDPLTNNIFFLSGEKWRKLRMKVTPTFTSSKMKEMFPLLKDISYELIKTCDKAFCESDVVEIKDLLGRYTIDTISSIAFGYDCKSLNDRNNEFIRHALLALNMSPIKIAIGTFAPLILELLRLPVLDKRATKFFTGTFQNMIKYRRQNNVVRKDFLNLIMQLMDKGVLDDDQSAESSVKMENDDKLTMNEAQAQSFIFFLAGYETSSSTMTYLLYELAMNPEIQENVHREIDEFMANGDVTYARVKDELPYLDMVFSETLRKHSSFSSLNRTCVEDWQIPNSNIVIKKGIGVIVSVSGIHHDPCIYPNPEKFDPTRFNEENLALRSPYAYLPFGTGPKACIGTRFGILQSKLALLAFLSKYKLYTCEKTMIPVQYSKKSFVQTPAAGIYLRLEKR